MATFAKTTIAVSADGTKIIVSTDTANGPLDLSGGASPTGFTVVGATLASAALAGDTIELTLSAAVNRSASVTVAYAPGNVIDSNDPADTLAAFGATAADQSANTVIGTFAKGTMTVAADGLTITIPTTGSTGPLLPATLMGGFTVTVEDVVRTFTTSVSTTNVVLTLPTPIYKDEVLKVAYAGWGVSGGNVKDSATPFKALAAFTATTIDTADVTAVPSTVSGATRILWSAVAGATHYMITVNNEPQGGVMTNEATINLPAVINHIRVTAFGPNGTISSGDVTVRLVPEDSNIEVALS